MRILASGGAGLIGSHVVEQCLDAAHDVAAIDNLFSGKQDNLPMGVPLYEVDIADAAAVRKVFTLVKPERHTPGRTDFCQLIGTRTIKGRTHKRFGSSQCNGSSRAL